MRIVILIFITSIFLSTQGSSQNFEDLEFGTDTTFEVVTWNIEWFPKDGQTTIYDVAQIIDALDADIIGVQEIDDKTRFGQMISNLDGWSAYFLYGEYHSLAYIYKTATVELLDVYEIYTESDYWRQFPRSPLVMEVLFKGVKFVIINNHLKCCGDGVMNLLDAWDEETRRYDASVDLEEFINMEYSEERVILLGDLNDILTDPPENNVFKAFYDRPYNYLFADQQLAESDSGEWSYPGWPSHLDHLLITDELFHIFWDAQTIVKTIKLDEFYPGGMDEYDARVSDHRPVGVRFPVPYNFGISESGNPDHLIRIFPNPASHYVNIKCVISIAPDRLEIFSSTGEIIYSAGQDIERIDVSSLPAGIYLMHIYTEQGIFHKRLIIQR